MYKVGFANLDEQSEYAVLVRESLEREVAKHDDIELICRDNALNDDRAQQNAHEFAEMGVDAVVMYHINENIGNLLRSILMPIPTICIDIPIPFTPYVGIDNDEMGTLASEALQLWIEDNWGGTLHKVLGLIDSRVRFAQSRVTKVVDTMKETFGAKNTVSSLYLDMRYDRDENHRIVHDVLTDWREEDHIAIINYNDSSALAALEAVENLGLGDSTVFVIQGLTVDMINTLVPGPIPVLGTRSFPEKYGETLLPVILDVLHQRTPVLRNMIPLESVVRI